MDLKDLWSGIFNTASSFKPRFDRVYSRDNLPDKIKDGAYVINLDEYCYIRTHWITFHALNNNVTYFDKFGVEHIPERYIIVTNIEYKHMIQ